MIDMKTSINFIVYVYEILIENIIISAFIAVGVVISPFIKKFIEDKFPKHFWKKLSNNSCFIIPAHPKKRLSTSTELKSNTGTGYNDCIAVGKLSQFIYSIGKYNKPKYQIPIYQAGKGDGSIINIWREKTKYYFDYEKTDLPTQLLDDLKKQNYIIIGGPESNIISKILLENYIKDDKTKPVPKFEGNNVKLNGELLIDSNNKENSDIYGNVLLYSFIFMRNKIEIKMMVIAGCHGSDTRRIIPLLQEKEVIKKIDSILNESKFNCCITIRYNKLKNVIEKMNEKEKNDEDIQGYNIKGGD